MNESSYLLVRLAAVDGMLANLADEDAVLRLSLEDERSVLVCELLDHGVVAPPPTRPDRGFRPVGEIVREIVAQLMPKAAD
jgi:hypothetical protein